MWTTNIMLPSKKFNQNLLFQRKHAKVWVVCLRSFFMPIVIIQFEFGQLVSKIACLSSFMKMLPKIYEFLLTRWCDVHIWCINKTNFVCLIVCCLNVLPLHNVACTYTLFLWITLQEKTWMSLAYNNLVQMVPCFSKVKRMFV
jgi:hypothetical protein